MKLHFAAALALIFSFNAWAGGPAYPKTPDAELTPGTLCTSPNSYRYPEKVAYCERNVDSVVKRGVIHIYDQKLGYRIETMARTDFKIDHYIPLCMGGSNETSNLWPQHRSVYEITDPLEQELCEKMADGHLSQAKAMDLMRKAKNHLDEVDEIRDSLNSL